MKFSKKVLDEARFPEFIDSTMLLTSACATKFFYKHCFHLAPQQKSIHLHAGGAFAQALQTTREKFHRDGVGEDRALLEGFREFIKYWGDYEAPEKSYKDFVNTAAAFFDYFRTYPLAEDHIQPFRKADGSPAVEFTFSVPLPIMHPDTGNPLVYVGRSDMVGQLTQQSNLLAIVDEKTTYSFTNDWARNFALRGQFLGYTWAAQQYSMPVNLFVVRGIAIQQREIKHLEAMFSFPQWQLERWYMEMLQKVQYLVTCWKLKEFPMNYGDICSSYGGCEMLDLCTSENPENWFDTFARFEWNPLDKGIIHDTNA